MIQPTSFMIKNLLKLKKNYKLNLFTTISAKPIKLNGANTING